MNKAILSTKYPSYAEALRQIGYEIIKSGNVSCFIDYERGHADMQCLIIDDTAFVLSCCQALAKSLENDYNIVLCGDHISGKYPENVCLNAVFLNDTLIGKLNAIDAAVINYCKKMGYSMINVNQGYTKCSCAIVSEDALITADNGIYSSLKESKIDVLKIEEGRVRLDGAEYGFIGGASGYKDHRIYFTGNIALHPEHDRIKSFCEKHNAGIISLSDNMLHDIGGIVFC